MKRLILLLGILSTGFQCGDDFSDVPASPPIENYGVWNVKNATSLSLMIRPGDYSLQPTLIPPGATLELYSRKNDIWDMPSFERFLYQGYWYSWEDENKTFEIFSDDGTLLKKSGYLEKDEPGRQFFNESSWIKTREAGDRVDELKIVWTFEIKEEDIQ